MERGRNTFLSFGRFSGRLSGRIECSGDVWESDPLMSPMHYSAAVTRIGIRASVLFP